MKKFTFFLILFVFFSIASYSQKSKIMLGGDAGFGVPTGDFSESAKLGFGLNGVFSYFFQNDLIFTGTLGYWNFGMKGSHANASGSYSVIPINAGIQYRFPWREFTPFIGLETFLYHFSASVKISGWGSSSDSETQFGFTPLVGIVFPLQKNMEFRAQMKYVIIFTSGSNATFLNLLGGIHFWIDK
ncbi:MAG: outer membrane beta-barrel protein [Candidatus Kapaibacteriales bacterium]